MSAVLAPYLDQLEPDAGVRREEAAAGETPSPGFMGEVHAAGLPWRVFTLLAVHLLETLLLIGSWACVGLGALSGRLDAGWLAAWALALGSTVPLQAVSTWLQGVVALGFGGVLKERLLVGAMAMDPDLIRSKGAGEILSETLETEAIGDLGANGAIATVLALLELLMAPVLFHWGAAFGSEAAILIAWIALSLGLIVHNARLRADWTLQRLNLTDRLVENMTAHRTRVAQQSPAHWHDGEDADLDRYLQASRKLDGSSALIAAALPRVYVVAAILALAPAFLNGTSSMTQLAVTFGMILFATAALQRLSFGFSDVAASWVGWKMAAPLIEAARAVQPDGPAVETRPTPQGIPVLHAQSLGFVHPGRLGAVLAGCSLSVHRGERILLEGTSGGGKSTLAAILAGLRAAGNGFVLAGGLDRATLGDEGWRRRIALAPQYHENHIVAAPLIFNLLMARAYPHTAPDVAEAEEVCRELGLTDLIGRMPAGLNQFVGDTGWRLSQGERSRIFLARALLQKAEVVVLDESLAALDPENFRVCLQCIARRAPTMILIAHL
ncbi:MAG: ABC transporter ATP-binding protein [Steroidobacteraceae bacterium]|jgi:ATP-binding cassette subfamily B protein